MMETTLSHPPLAMLPTHESTARRVGLVMTYNQRETCISAISSLLAQTLALDLIIVSDDCSTDGTYGVITDHFSKNGKPSNVELYRSEKNLGFIPHFNTLLESYCKDDDLIVYNAGDDISETSRVEEFYREYVTKGKPRYFLGHSYVTSFGSGTEEILVPPIESIKDNRELCLIASAYHIGASQVFTGALFSDFGPILFDDCYEDLTLGYRALLKNAYHFIPRALLRYRVGGLSSWQKNPLEKKRGRLKSTLTQRAVDSMRSGDFEALTIIQDCYSQYGFSHTQHHSRVQITIVSDETLDSLVYTYTIADHFTVIGNICAIKQETPAQFLDSINNENMANADSPDLVWVITSRISSRSLLEIPKCIASLKATKLVLDLGLSPSLKTIFLNENTTFNIEQFKDNYPNIGYHTSNIHTYNELTKSKESPSTTYLRPLQNIDGPDPITPGPKDKRGIAVIIGTSPESREYQAVIERAFKANKSGLGNLHVFKVFHAETDSITAIHSPGSGHETPSEHIELENFDYLVIVCGATPEYAALVDYWWGLGARLCLPTFINAESACSSHLTHGSNCLFVSSREEAWNAAFTLVRSSFEPLRGIASAARKDAYFNSSIQKAIRDVAAVIGKSLRLNLFFDKFLAL